MPDPASSALGVALVGGEELSDEQIMAQLRQEFLRQLASQRPAALYLGQLTYSDAAGYSAFANFLDDFSGPSGRAQKDFGATIFYPDQFHQTYFFQDTWLPAPSLSLTLGLRYENFGQVANALRYPAFAGFDPAKFLVPNHVNTDNKDFGPAFGLAWSPRALRASLLSRLLGDGRTVSRGGYQINYDPLFTQPLSLLLAPSSPNSISTFASAPGTGRGSPNWSAQLPAAASSPSLLDAQRGAFEKDFRNAYTEHWSFGFQRQFSNKLVFDGSYLDSQTHRLLTSADVNSRQLNEQRLHPDFGHHSHQPGKFLLSRHAMAPGPPVCSRLSSQCFLHLVAHPGQHQRWTRRQQPGPDRRELTSVPVAQGGLKVDRGPSDLNRTHRLTVAYMWDIPGPAGGFWKLAFSGWSLSGITSFQSGARFTVGNGFDRNNDGQNSDRPDIGNPRAPLNSRAVVTPSSGSQFCSTGYRNPDTGLCVNPGDVHWVQGTGLPNAFTVGRNTLVAGGINNFDLTLTKSFPIGEQRRLEFRWEAFNALNHPQFTQIPAKDVVGTPPGRFLNRDFTDSDIRSMWVQVKVLF